MPMFATLLASDIDETVAWYIEVLGFINLFSVPGPGGAPVLVHLRRWQFQDLLVRPAAGMVTPATGCTLSFAAVYDELDALAERARGHCAGSFRELVDTRWNTRDLVTADPDGNVVIFHRGPATAARGCRFLRAHQAVARRAGVTARARHRGHRAGSLPCRFAVAGNDSPDDMRSRLRRPSIAA
jgi:catechol 2,3-dioxygenase-like lactoylglutathione lyase family enzyme